MTDCRVHGHLITGASAGNATLWSSHCFHCGAKVTVAPEKPIVATRACTDCYACFGEDHKHGCNTAAAIREHCGKL